ncbi:3-keto-disaccharide hydrolase [Aeoliella mucimassa]|uniref:3-keto-alpha-glucoside-1,2-lyase/3-keto-2-hydroxy-glucal hydratase domain-containing protein n=1 Tax=Aeoliella mucimassa TaxID=2527972 RepID=A0A518AKK5_9BACT|nr:DUF1080 domain-containing protein [Aeoliella mucimassa]QDU55259.1 hypothetical protein Pan181_14460 [Aeoliella mucimassa]
MTNYLDFRARRFVLVATIVALSGMAAKVANATAAIQRVFINEIVKPMDDKDYMNFVRRKAKCNVCHQGKGGHSNNPYGAALATLIDHEEDEKDKEKVLAAIKQANEMPFGESGETFGERIAAGKLPGGDDLEELQKEVEPEPIVLFDGETLEGWVGATDSYEVRDGAIVCPAGKGGNLFTKDEYADFEFSFEFLLTPGANNGIGIRAPLEGDAAYSGFEIQVLDNTADKYANLQPYQYHGSVYGIAPAKRGFLKPVGEWNTEVIRVKGRQITVTLNGEVITDVDLDEVAPEGKTKDGHNHPGLTREKGHIGFCGHGDEVHYRNLKVVPLVEHGDDDEDEEEDDDQ